MRPSADPADPVTGVLLASAPVPRALLASVLLAAAPPAAAPLASTLLASTPVTWALLASDTASSRAARPASVRPTMTSAVPSEVRTSASRS